MAAQAQWLSAAWLRPQRWSVAFGRVTTAVQCVLIEREAARWVSSVSRKRMKCFRWKSVWVAGPCSVPPTRRHTAALSARYLLPLTPAWAFRLRTNARKGGSECPTASIIEQEHIGCLLATTFLFMFGETMVKYRLSKTFLSMWAHELQSNAAYIHSLPHDRLRNQDKTEARDARFKIFYCHYASIRKFWRFSLPWDTKRKNKKAQQPDLRFFFLNCRQRESHVESHLKTPINVWWWSLLPWSVRLIAIWSITFCSFPNGAAVTVEMLMAALLIASNTMRQLDGTAGLLSSCLVQRRK